MPELRALPHEVSPLRSVLRAGRSRAPAVISPCKPIMRMLSCSGRQALCRGASAIRRRPRCGKHDRGEMSECKRVGVSGVHDIRCTATACRLVFPYPSCVKQVPVAPRHLMYVRWCVVNEESMWSSRRTWIRRTFHLPEAVVCPSCLFGSGPCGRLIRACGPLAEQPQRHSDQAH